MGLLKDFYHHELHIRKRYWPRIILNPRNWKYAIKFRHQRAERGWSNRDTWNGGEYVAEVTAGILYFLDREHNPIDWDCYFSENYPNNYGYSSLTQVADDLQLYIEWDAMQYIDPLYLELEDLGNEIRWGIELQVYEQAKQAMHFVAENIGHLWW